MSATAPATTAPPALPANDFADWLSPILVKELRQGLKSRAFVSAFIIVQVMMILLVGLQLIGHEDTPFGRPRYERFDGFFYAVVWIPLLLLMPARGLSAVSEEARANTFDLVQLTRLTAFRIVLGKWVALIAQTLLLVTSELPYIVLRYFFGGVDVISELNGIALVIVVSCIFTAGAIALSTAHLAVRLIILVASLPLVSAVFSIYSLAYAFGGRSGGISMAFSSTPSSWWIVLAVAAAYIFVFLEFAASKIAPVAENHSARKRTSALVFAVICVLTATIGIKEWLGVAVFFSVPLLVLIIVESLTEAGSHLPTTYAAFAKRGVPGRIMGRLLYPGTSTGVAFTACVIALMWAAFEIVRHYDPSAVGPNELPLYLTFWPLLFFALISPLPIMHFLPRVRQRFWLYVLVQLLFVIFFAVAAIAANGSSYKNSKPFSTLAFSPTSALIALIANKDDPDLARGYQTTTLISGLIILGFLLLQIFRDFRFMSHLERLALKQNTPEPS